MMDGELRGIVLKKFYELRNQPGTVNVPALPEMATLDPEPYRIVNICEQLAEHGLINWTSTESMTSYGGFGKISASGVDVVEGTAPAPLTVTFNDHSISVSRS